MAEHVRVFPIKKVKAWSFSTLSLYRTCPFKYYAAKILKIEEPQNDAMMRGQHIHKLAEDFIKGEITVLPDELQHFKHELVYLQDVYHHHTHPIMVEESWAFTKDWNQTVWNDWTYCWVRIKLDLAIEEDAGILKIIDWKTGKIKDDSKAEYMEQMELYATAGLLMNPHVHTVVPRLAYLDHGLMYPPEGAEVSYTRKDLPRLIKLWEGRVKKMMSDERFDPTPNRFCGWCHYRKSNNGICEKG